MPRRSVDAVKEDIKSTSQFYLLESIKIEALTTTRTLLNIEEDYLQSLVTREVMTDDYDSHDTLIPRYAFAYNSRLNIANMKKMLFAGYNAASVFVIQMDMSSIGMMTTLPLHTLTTKLPILYTFTSSRTAGILL